MIKKIFKTQEEFCAEAASEIKKTVAEATETAFIGLSGGKTPLPVYAALNPEDVDRVEFFLVDERCVPAESEHSNYHAIRAALPEEAVLQPIDTLLSPAEAALAYSDELRAIPEGKFDLIILGMGADGHVASLFPYDISAHESEGSVIPAINKRAPNPPVRERVTITFKIMLEAKRLLLLVSGIPKADAVTELLEGTKTAAEFPAKRLLNHPNFKIFYCIE